MGYPAAYAAGPTVVVTHHAPHPHSLRGGGWSEPLDGAYASDVSDLFGGGLSTAMGGTSVAERNLDRITLAIGLIWAACVVGLGLLLSTGR